MSGAENVERIVCVVSDNTLSELFRDVRAEQYCRSRKSQHGPGRRIISVN